MEDLTKQIARVLLAINPGAAGTRGAAEQLAVAVEAVVRREVANAVGAAEHDSVAAPVAETVERIATLREVQVGWIVRLPWLGSDDLECVLSDNNGRVFSVGSSERVFSVEGGAGDRLVDVISVPRDTEPAPADQLGPVRSDGVALGEYEAFFDLVRDALGEHDAFDRAFSRGEIPGPMRMERLRAAVTAIQIKRCRRG